jgi:DNA modification methylase
VAKRKSKNDRTEPLFPREVPRTRDGYYTGDKPNPHLRAFVEQHLNERPYDPGTDTYDVPAFDRPIETTKATAIYNMHTYWSKKPHDAIRQYIRHYTQPGDLVLDSFCGSGGTALAALMERRKAIAIDRSPAATFITKNYCTPVDPDELQEACEQVQARVADEIEWLYETRCDRCGGKATTVYTVYSQVFQCPRCLEKVALFDCVVVRGKTKAGRQKTISVCPHCYERGQEEVIKSQSQKLGYVPVMVSYLCRSGCRPARGARRHDDDGVKAEVFAESDLKQLEALRAGRIPHWYPRGFDMTGFNRYQRDALRLYGVREVADLYTHRNLWALSSLASALRSFAQPTDSSAYAALWLAMTTISLTASKMLREQKRAIQPGTYYMPQIFREVKATTGFRYKVDQLTLAFRELIHELPECIQCVISTQSATNLDALPANCVDYIFTDPPYAEKVQYGELNYVWEAWLGFDASWHDEEIIVNSTRGRTEADWSAMMKVAMGECHRVLKPGRWLSLCFHDTSEGTWQLVQDIMAEVGFEVGSSDGALFIDTEQKSFNQRMADKVTKRDLVINFRKPNVTASVPRVPQAVVNKESTFGESARGVIRDYLSANPGSTKDRVYDAVVSRLVRAGQMEAHDFDEMLRSVADEVSEPVKRDLFHDQDPDLFGTHVVGHWYLRDGDAGTDEVDRATADAAAGRIRVFLVERCQAELSKSEPSWRDLNEKVRELAETLAGLPELDDNRDRRRVSKELRETRQKLEKIEARRAQWQQHALHYSEILEFYLPLTPKPRETLIELLEDYFYQTDEGHWRPPANDDEAKLKSDARGQAMRRRVRQLYKAIEAGDAIPAALQVDDATLAAWLRYCKQAGMYAEGKALYERAGLNLEQLSEEAAVGAEEDYQTCVRILTRAADATPVSSRKAGR